MFCNNCGSPIPDGSNACPNCGKVFAAPQAEPAQQVPPQQFQQQVPPQQFQQQVPPQQFQQQVPPQQFQQQVPPQQFQQQVPPQFQQQVPPQFQQQVPPQFQQQVPPQFMQGYGQMMYPPRAPFDLLKILCGFFGRTNKTSALLQLILGAVLLVAFILWMTYPGAGYMNGFSGFADFFKMRHGAMIVAGIFHIFSFLAIAGMLTFYFLKNNPSRDTLFKVFAVSYIVCKLVVFILTVAVADQVLGGDIAAIILTIGMIVLSVMIGNRENPPVDYFARPQQPNPLA